MTTTDAGQTDAKARSDTGLNVGRARRDGVRWMPLGLVILDGFGLAPEGSGNAVKKARMPRLRELWERYPHTKLRASGEDVGLAAGDMGNSNVGHLTMGLGRILPMGRAWVDAAIRDGSLFETAVVQKLIRGIREGRRVHLLGLWSTGGVHSDERHVLSLLGHLREATGGEGGDRLFLHAFLDGRDVPPKSASEDLARLAAWEEESGGYGRLASLGGRYYGMDRDHRWERVERAYRVMAGQEGERARSGMDALQAAYERGETDEFVLPTRIVGPDGEDVGPIRSGDLAFFWNFRADRGRELTQALGDPGFTAFDRRMGPLEVMTLTEYDESFPYPVALRRTPPTGSLGEAVSRAGRLQLRAAETEKYAHVTYFLNGGEEVQFPGEERILVPSQKVATYDLSPGMSAPELTREVCEALTKTPYDLFVLNYANPDMLGHTGQFEATVSALEILDGCLADLARTVFGLGGGVLLTADHGNAEYMRDSDTGAVHTAHTTAPVPFLAALPGLEKEGVRLREGGGLRDVGPTVLSCLGLSPTAEMTGEDLFRV